MPPSADNDTELARLKRRLERERATRLQAEAISEKGLRDLYERQRELQLLAEIATAANETASVSEALQFAVTQVCEYMNWEVGHSYFTTGADTTRCLRSTGMWYGADGEHLAEFRRMTEETEFAPGIGLPGCALASGKPLSVIDVTKESNFPRQPSAMKCGLRGASAFPVLSGQDVVAVLEFFTTAPREPSEAFLSLMSQVGLQLGRVVERQRAETRLHDHAAELTRARDDAKAADKAKSAFLATMSHELRTPLNAIIGFSEMIQTELLGPIGNAYYKGYATNIFNSGTHLLGIINDILDISKLDSDVVDLRDDLVDLAGTIGECVRLLDPQAVQANVRLSQAIAPDLPMLRADQRRLRQILFNLISNAIKFTPEGGHVRASATRRREGLVIAVADTGIGMTAEQIPKALERFGQIDSTLARKYEGTGLGLPLTKRLVELHGGVLAIDSKPSVGTTVSATFPEIRIVARPHAAIMSNARLT